MSIVFSVDVYGSDARHSATADFVELLALTGRTVTLAELADFLSDSSVLLRRTRYSTHLGAADDDAIDLGDSGEAPLGADPLEPSRDAARRVLDVLGQRSRILGSDYPFEVGEEGVRSKDRKKSRSNPYVALLAVATAHAYALDVGVDIEDAFEDTVARAVRTRIPRTAAFGAAKRAGRSFAETLTAIGREIRVPVTTEAVLLSVNTQDGGADTLSHLDWGDDRTGRWTYVGQVTCARSDDWEKKVNEAKRGRWKLLLGNDLRPTAYLAVPHHVEDLTLQRLLQETQSLVLDRLRLVRHLKPLSSVERKIANAVLGTPVEYL